jgi:hypothetical protein
MKRPMNCRATRSLTSTLTTSRNYTNLPEPPLEFLEIISWLKSFLPSPLEMLSASGLSSSAREFYFFCHHWRPPEDITTLINYDYDMKYLSGSTDVTTEHSLAFS